ncbi:MAG: Gfo/Idh/MocA family oxidoreductase, partial [Gemmatimonadetes bacterium]|nr:Gfo/Idh/MocA family oxidoreductase [Gemmatimonadota bacterium]
SGWEEAVSWPGVDVVAVCTPNGFLAEIGTAALAAGRHVLLEKPMGRNLAEAEALAAAARASGRLLKVGFNHRYHPAVRRAREVVASGAIGRVVNLRARYGHGARPGCEGEWRADPVLAGGGELIDQGVHVADLFHWFAGPAREAFGVVQTAVWRVAPLEDNGYGVFRFEGGAVGQLHVSMTQWKNLFSLEVTGERGAVVVEGLGGSYGTERLVQVQRRMEGGVPEVHEEAFPGPDDSWAAEWDDFVAGVREGRPVLGGVDDGLVAMRMIDALYRSVRARAMVVV